MGAAEHVVAAVGRAHIGVVAIQWAAAGADATAADIPQRADAGIVAGVAVVGVAARARAADIVGAGVGVVAIGIDRAGAQRDVLRPDLVAFLSGRYREAKGLMAWQAGALGLPF